jgi:hypothetical protein
VKFSQLRFAHPVVGFFGEISLSFVRGGYQVGDVDLQPRMAQ